jgi:membrane protein required for colicin V production
MVIDSFFVVLMILATIKGYSKGLIVAVFSFVAIIIGLAAAMKLSAIVAGWLHDSTSISMAWLPILSFALVMFGMVLLVRMGAKMVQRSVEFALMGWVNKAGGILLYAALYTTVLSVVLFFAEEIHLLKPHSIEASKFYPFIQPWGPKAINGFGAVIPLFKDLFTQLENFFATVGPKAQ